MGSRLSAFSHFALYTLNFALPLRAWRPLRFALALAIRPLVRDWLANLLHRQARPNKLDRPLRTHAILAHARRQYYSFTFAEGDRRHAIRFHNAAAIQRHQYLDARLRARGKCLRLAQHGFVYAETRCRY